MALIFNSWATDIGALTACLLVAIYLYFKKAFRYWEKQNAPFIKPVFPFGTFTDSVLLRKPIGEVFKNFYKQLEGEKYGGIFMFTKPEFIFRDPDIIKNVLVKDFSSFHDRGIYMNEEVEPLTGHLFFLPGQRWRNLRVKLSPTFTSGKMKMMFGTLVDCGLQLQDCIENIAKTEKEVEIKDILARYSTDIISSCAFGIQCNCLKNPDAEFRQWGRKIFTSSVKSNIIRILSSLVPQLVRTLKLSGLDKNISKYFREMVQETIEYREKNNLARNDFMQLLIQLKNKGIVEPDHESDEGLEAAPSNYKLSINNLAAQAFVFFLAGFETSSTTMTFCLYELSRNPDIQGKLREEILKVLKKHDGKITYESINEMEYLDKVVSETLRKYPPVPILIRECTKTYNISDSNIVLEKGISTVIPVLALHHDPKHYPNPERFDPERFSEEEKQKRHPYVYLPFGEGPRICIGMRFGLMQTKVGLVSLLSKYQFRVSKKTPIPLVFDKKTIILSPVGGMWLEMKKCT